MTRRSAPPEEPRPADAPRPGRGARLLFGLDTGITWLVKSALVMSGACVLVIVFIGVADTVGRALWNAPFVGAVEISEALLAVTIFAALPYAQMQGGHVVVDVFSNSFGPRLTRIATVIVLVLTLAVLVFLTWRTGITAELGMRHNEVSAGYLPVPIWLAKIVAAVCLLVACLECLRELVRSLWGLHPSGYQRPAEDAQLGEGL